MSAAGRRRTTPPKRHPPPVTRCEACGYARYGARDTTCPSCLSEAMCGPPQQRDLQVVRRVMDATIAKPSLDDPNACGYCARTILGHEPYLLILRNDGRGNYLLLCDERCKIHFDARFVLSYLEHEQQRLTDADAGRADPPIPSTEA